MTLGFEKGVFNVRFSKEFVTTAFARGMAKDGH